jgi:hypothetical protein
MSKKLQLHIAEPCHENWDNMSPAEKGRFCDSCQKQVVDFSNMSDREIVQFFKKPSTGSVCGRFMNDQLERDMIVEKKRLPWIKYFFQFVFPAFVISKQAHTQGMVVREKPIVETPLSTKGQVKKPSSKSELKVIVTDITTTLPIPYASVNIISVNASATKQSASTKADGSSLFKIKNSEDAFDIEISSVGYKTETIKILPGEVKNSKVIKVGLKIHATELPEVTVVLYPVQGAVKVFTNRCYGTVNDSLLIEVSYTEDKELPLQPKAIASKIFPNPLPQSQTATIEIDAKENGWIYAMITDANGKMIAMQKWKALKGINRFTVDATPGMIPGIYFIRLTNEKGKLIRTDRLIIQ